MKLIKKVFICAILVFLGLAAFFWNDYPWNVSNWSTYKNTQYGYSLRVPGNWITQVPFDGEGYRDPTSATPHSHSFYIIPFGSGGKFKTAWESDLSGTKPFISILAEPWVNDRAQEELQKRGYDVSIQTINSIQMAVYEHSNSDIHEKVYFFRHPNKEAYFKILIKQKKPETKFDTMQAIVASFSFNVPEEPLPELL